MSGPSPYRQVLKSPKDCLVPNCPNSKQKWFFPVVGHGPAQPLVCQQCRRMQSLCKCAKASAPAAPPPPASPSKLMVTYLPLSDMGLVELWCEIIFEDLSFADFHGKLTKEHFVCKDHFTPGSKVKPRVPHIKVGKSREEETEKQRSWNTWIQTSS